MAVGRTTTIHMATFSHYCFFFGTTCMASSRCFYKSSCTTTIHQEFDLVAQEGSTNEEMRESDNNRLRLHIQVLRKFESGFTPTNKTNEFIYNRLRFGKMSCFEVYHKYTDEIKTLLVRKIKGDQTTDSGGANKKRKPTGVDKSNVLTYLIRKPRSSEKKKRRKVKKPKGPRRTASTTTTGGVVDGNQQEGEEEKEQEMEGDHGQEGRHTRSGRSYK